MEPVSFSILGFHGGKESYRTVSVHASVNFVSVLFIDSFGLIDSGQWRQEVELRIHVDLHLIALNSR